MNLPDVELAAIACRSTTHIRYTSTVLHTTPPGLSLVHRLVRRDSERLSSTHPTDSLSNSPDRHQQLLAASGTRLHRDNDTQAEHRCWQLSHGLPLPLTVDEPLTDAPAHQWMHDIPQLPSLCGNVYIHIRLSGREGDGLLRCTAPGSFAGAIRCPM
jgi:hypothetical protein